MPSMSPLQMTGLAQQQMRGTGGLTPDDGTAQTYDINRIADQSLMGSDIAWGDLYNTVQKDFWNNIIRDPSTGKLATVNVRDYGGGWKTLPGDDQPSQVAPTPWKPISVIDYINDLDKYRYHEPDAGNEGTASWQVKGRRYDNTGLSRYFMDTANPYETSAGILDLMNRLGVDTTSETIGPDNRNYTTDFSGIANRYVDRKVDEARSVGETTGNWFADNPAFNEYAANADYISLKRGLPKEGSLFGMVTPLLSEYAANTKQPFDLSKDKTNADWNNYVTAVRNAERAEDKAFDRAAIGAFTSVFAAPFVGALAPAIQGAAPALGQLGSQIAAGALYGAGSSALTGGNIGRGALTGGVGAGLGNLFSGANSFSAADYAQLAEQGYNAATINQILGSTGVGAGTTALYSAGITNPYATNLAGNFIKEGGKSLASGQKFDPRSAVTKSIPGLSSPLSQAAQFAMKSMR